jgi:hypothetical protein
MDKDASLRLLSAGGEIARATLGNRRRRFAVFLAALVLAGISVLVVVAVRAGTDGRRSRSPRRGGASLTWAPPRCGDSTHRCRDLYLANTGSHQEPFLRDSVDYRIHLPAHGPLAGGLTIDGGRNVIIIGGEIDLPTPCSDASSDCHGIYIRRGSASGEVYIEGVYIRNPDPRYRSDRIDTGDGIDVDDYPGVTDIVLQNVRIDGIKGCDPANPEAHADVFQPYDAGRARFYVDHLTGVTDCQGMQLDPDLAYSDHGLTPAAATFKNVNIDVYTDRSDPKNQYAWWFTYGVDSCLSFPITLINDYAKEPRKTLSHGAVWPDPANRGQCSARYTHGVVRWDRLRTLRGVIRNGAPRGGDFVPAGLPGLNYKPPPR